MPYNKKTRKKSKPGFFRLRGAICLGQVVTGKWPYQETKGFLFAKEGEILFLRISEFVMYQEDRSALIFWPKNSGKVFKIIAGEKFFEEDARGDWIYYEGR